MLFFFFGLIKSSFLCGEEVRKRDLISTFKRRRRSQEEDEQVKREKHTTAFFFFSSSFSFIALLLSLLYNKTTTKQQHSDDDDGCKDDDDESIHDGKDETKKQKRSDIADNLYHRRVRVPGAVECSRDYSRTARFDVC